MTNKRKYTFKRWFAHWCAFQLTALKLDCWKFKFLLHDIDKPILNLIISNKTTKKLHQKWSSHHMEFFGKKDYLSMIIDWECAHITKSDSPLLAKEVLEIVYKDKIDNKTYLDITAKMKEINL